jgi:hypothetical protein
MNIDLPYTVAPTELAWTAVGIVVAVIVSFGLSFWIRKLKQLLDRGINGRSQLQVFDHIISESLLLLAQLCVVASGVFAMTEPPPAPNVEVTQTGIAVAVALILLEVCLATHSIAGRILWELIVRKTRTARERQTDRVDPIQETQ